MGFMKFHLHPTFIRATFMPSSMTPNCLYTYKVALFDYSSHPFELF